MSANNHALRPWSSALGKESEAMKVVGSLNCLSANLLWPRLEIIAELPFATKTCVCLLMDSWGVRGPYGLLPSHFLARTQCSMGASEKKQSPRRNAESFGPFILSEYVPYKLLALIKLLNKHQKKKEHGAIPFIKNFFSSGAPTRYWPKSRGLHEK